MANIHNCGIQTTKITGCETSVIDLGICERRACCWNHDCTNDIH